MKKFLFIFLSLTIFLPLRSSNEYEEKISDMLIQCNEYQSQMFADNRTSHSCEKENFSDSYSYVITQMETRYSKQKFWCLLILKDEYFKLKFKFWFSHKNFNVDAYGIKFNKPSGDKWESRALFKISLAVIVPKGNLLLPEILGFEINGADKCPLCGRKLEQLEAVSRISGGEESSAVKWPWHAAVYHITPSSFNYRCGGSMIQSNAVITAAHCVTNSGKKLSEQTLQIGLGETEMMVDSGFRSGVFKSIVHQRFDHYILENDIALLVLENQIKYSTTVLPICLPSKGVMLGDGMGVVVGFGSTEVDVDGSLMLMEAEIPIATNEDCFESNVDFFEVFLDDDKFCAGQEHELKNVCEGDTGGGFYMKKDDLWILKGVSSETSRSGTGVNPTCAKFAIFTDVVKHLDWIAETLNTI